MAGKVLTTPRGVKQIKLRQYRQKHMVRAMNDRDDISPEDGTEDAGGERIAKALARAGVGSRRDIERMIGEGRIALNGQTLKSPALNVASLEGITVDGEKVGEVRETRLWRYNKRKGTLTTHKDPEGRRTVFDQLPKHMGRVISIGRLDMNTEGLLLLTNDGELARWLELPANAIVRRYRVRAHGRVDEKALAKLADGVTIDGIHYGAIDAKLEKSQGANSWLTVAISEGKNREVRRVMEHLGLAVNRLIRTHYGPFTLGTLPDGAVAQVTDAQLHDVLSDFFKTETRSVAAPRKPRDPSKWAKAKPKPVKPGAKKWAKNRARDRDETERPNRGKGKPGVPKSAAKPAPTRGAPKRDGQKPAPARGAGPKAGPARTGPRPERKPKP